MSVIYEIKLTLEDHQAKSLLYLLQRAVDRCLWVKGNKNNADKEDLDLKIKKYEDIIKILEKARVEAYK